MSRAYTTSSAVHEAEKWDLRLQRSNRRRTSLIAGAASLCLLFVISYVFTTNARVLRMRSNAALACAMFPARPAMEMI